MFCNRKGLSFPELFGVYFRKILLNKRKNNLTIFLTKYISVEIKMTLDRFQLVTAKKSDYERVL